MLLFFLLPLIDEEGEFEGDFVIQVEDDFSKADNSVRTNFMTDKYVPHESNKVMVHSIENQPKDEVSEGKSGVSKRSSSSKGYTSAVSDSGKGSNNERSVTEGKDVKKLNSIESLDIQGHDKTETEKSATEDRNYPKNCSVEEDGLGDSDNEIEEVLSETTDRTKADEIVDEEVFDFEEELKEIEEMLDKCPLEQEDYEKGKSESASTEDVSHETKGSQKEHMAQDSVQSETKTEFSEKDSKMRESITGNNQIQRQDAEENSSIKSDEKTSEIKTEVSEELSCVNTEISGKSSNTKSEDLATDSSKKNNVLEKNHSIRSVSSDKTKSIEAEVLDKQSDREMETVDTAPAEAGNSLHDLKVQGELYVNKCDTFDVVTLCMMYVLQSFHQKNQILSFLSQQTMATAVV